MNQETQHETGEHSVNLVRLFMDIKKAKKELEAYIGFPKCQDCGWRLGSEITETCACGGEKRYNPIRHKAAFDRARELQYIISTNEAITNKGSQDER
jgi:hypothetical protein